MLLWTAFLLGLVGSLHCAGMCGPLVLALPMTGGSGASGPWGRVIYHVGRITTYALLGAVFGLLGATLGLAGLQRWVSLGAGAAILIGLVASSRLGLKTPAFQAVGWIKSAFARLLQRRTFASLLLLGGINGLLPCGLVYAACAGAIASGGFFSGVEYMAMFGLGTLPMMLGLSLAGRKLQIAIGPKLHRLVPASLAVMGLLLLCRGLSLGIPYLSPDLSSGEVNCSACHPTAVSEIQTPHQP